jgi:hypothetical protein
MPVSTDLQRRLTDLYGAFNTRDIATVLDAMAADVAWPNGWEGGTLHGHDAVRDYWIRQWAQIDPVVRPTGFREEDDGRVAVLVHQLVRGLDGTVLADGPVTHVYRFRDGLVEAMEIRS